MPSVPEMCYLHRPSNDERKTPVKRRSRRTTKPSWVTEQFRQLNRLNQQGQLAIFVGAGISHGCGLPGWDDLVRKLAVAAYQGEGERSLILILDNHEFFRQVGVALTTVIRVAGHVRRDAQAANRGRPLLNATSTLFESQACLARAGRAIPLPARSLARQLLPSVLLC
jgi:hypothetical protein